MPNLMALLVFVTFHFVSVRDQIERERNQKNTSIVLVPRTKTLCNLNYNKLHFIYTPYMKLTFLFWVGKTVKFIV